MMRLVFPFSLICFGATGLFFALQMLPGMGIFLMFMFTPFWSVLLVNAGMIGTGIEALSGRVSRWWLVLPIAFYGGYWAAAAQDHRALRDLSASYDAANARVAIPFDPVRQALVFVDREGDAWLTQNYALPVLYSANSGHPEGYQSYRMMDKAVCTQVRQTPALQSASIATFGFHDGDEIGSMRLEERFCSLRMPELPNLPLVRVAQLEEKIVVARLPVTRATTTVTMPGGRQFRLFGGVAAPLSWIPMPVMGCALNSGAASWDCFAGFWRNGVTPIVSGNTQYERDKVVLARALGLKRVAIADRRGGDPTLVMAKVADVEEAALALQLANIDAMIANPLAEVDDWKVGVAANRPEVLAARAEGIMIGIERAAMAAGDNRYGARDSGRILAGLLAELPRDRFVAFGPRLLDVYAGAGRRHWLWQAEPLLRRLGDLGTNALPYLVSPYASRSSINGAAIEGICRVGPAGRAVAGPALIAMWSKSRDGFDRDEREPMFVAMRRIGIAPPPLAEDKHNQLAALKAEWADISPRSPARVCATRAEWQARREEEHEGKRRTNLD